MADFRLFDPVADGGSGATGIQGNTGILGAGTQGSTGIMGTSGSTGPAGPTDFGLGADAFAASGTISTTCANTARFGVVVVRMNWQSGNESGFLIAFANNAGSGENNGSWAGVAVQGNGAATSATGAVALGGSTLAMPNTTTISIQNLRFSGSSFTFDYTMSDISTPTASAISFVVGS